MTKKISLRVGAIAVAAAALVLVLAGCKATIYLYDASPSGYVYDASTGSAISGASVTLTPTDGSTGPSAVTTDSSGHYSFGYVPIESYELTASLSSYVFVRQVVNFSGSSQSLPNIVGYVPEDQYSVYILVTWDGSFKDVDLTMTYPVTKPANSESVNTTAPDYYDTTGVSATQGFGPETSTSTGLRETVDTAIPDSSNSISAGVYNIQKLVSNSGASGEPAGGPESIIVRADPYSNPNSITKTGGFGGGQGSGLPTGNTYYWIGVGEVYLSVGSASSGSNLASTNAAQGANPRVYILQGTTAASAQLGSFALASYVDISTASVVRINFFLDTGGTDVFQFLPDIRTQSTILSTNPQKVTPIVAFGRPR